MRKFTVTGTCIPRKNYMVDITGKLKQIKAMIDAEEYFTINRGRQYGKTTTLLALEKFLSDEYTVISISFEGFDEEEFANVKEFCQRFLGIVYDALILTSEPREYCEKWKNTGVSSFDDLGRHIAAMSRDKKLVLMIDEVDKVSNNRVFLGFLSKLREKFLARNAEKDFTFHSVILAGVYDIRNIKLRLIQEGLLTPKAGETAIHNSPWNIAADFDVNMSFSASEIETMLEEYEKDYQIGMNISEIANEIYNYTGGYPVLVSRICKHIDEKLDKRWDSQGIRQAIKLLLKENSPLFQSLIKNLGSNQDLSDMIYDILMLGGRWSFTFTNPIVGLGHRYGYFVNVNDRVRISNKIFEMQITNYFVSKEQLANLKIGVPASVHNEIIQNDKFNMQVCLEKFAKYYLQHFSKKDGKFIEREGRFFFLFFLNSLLNGRGFAHAESAFTDDKRMDVVVNYLDQQFIVELKIWYGEKRHENAFKQLLGYMDKMSLNEGYLLTFDFRKKKELKQEWTSVSGGKKIFSIIV